MKVDRITLTVAGDQATAVISGVTSAAGKPTRRTTFQVSGELSQSIQAAIGISTVTGQPVDLNQLVASLFNSKGGQVPAGAFTVKAVFGRVDRYERGEVDLSAEYAPETAPETAELEPSPGAYGGPR